MPIETALVAADEPQAVRQARSALRNGQLVAFPTDTVYGLAANVWDEGAVSRLYAVKGRDELKAVPVLLAGWSSLRDIADRPSDAVRRLAARFWPGPLTLVVRRLSIVPSVVSPGDTIGVRVPNHPFALKLLAAAGPLAVTSANRSGHPSPRSARAVLQEMAGRIELVIDGGETPGGIPSTVVDCTVDPPTLIREGPISIVEVLAAMRS